MTQNDSDQVWAEKMQLKSLYFIDGPVKGDHMYSDTLYPEILRHPRGGKSVNYWLIDDPQQDLLEYRYSIKKPRMLEEKVKALLDASVQKMYTAGVELDIRTMRQAAGEISAYYQVLELLGIDMQQYSYSIREPNDS